MLQDAANSLAVGPTDHGYTKLLLGQRGSGKTTLLAEIQELAARNGMLVLAADAATPGLPERITSCIADAQQRATAMGPTAKDPSGRNRRLSGVTLGPVGINWAEMPQARPRWSLRHRLETLASWAEEHASAVLLTVDEMHAGDRDELRRLAADIQRVTKVNSLPLAFIGAGLPEMAYTVLEDKKMTFLHRCSRGQMAPIVYDDAWRCLRLTVEEAGGTVHEDALGLMARSAAVSGLPYKLQSIGYHAWELSGSPDRPIDPMAASAAAAAADADMAEKVVTPMWHDLPGSDQSYLKALAECAGEAAPAEIAHRSPGVSARSLARSEQRLTVQSHVQRTESATVRLVGPVTAEIIRGFAAREADYAISHADPTSLPRLSRSQRCNELMPRAKTKCVLPLGHKGAHRSKR